MLQNIAENLDVKYTVLSNTGWVKNMHEVVFTNSGNQFISKVK